MLVVAVAPPLGSARSRCAPTASGSAFSRSRPATGKAFPSVSWRHSEPPGAVVLALGVGAWGRASADLVQRRVDLIVQDSTVGTEVTRRPTSTIPIVMALVLDPVGSGLVRSLASPGGNIAGLSMMATELYPKRLQLL